MFRFVEIEFYWNSPNHIDNSTYERKYIEPNSGDWFFHYSGVDIALKNEVTGGYGGILIRSIYDIKDRKIYKSPLVCSMRLFSGTNAFSESIKTKIVEFDFGKCKTIKSERIGLGKNAKENGADKFNYRFMIDPNEMRI